MSMNICGRPHLHKSGQDHQNANFCKPAIYRRYFSCST